LGTEEKWIMLVSWIACPVVRSIYFLFKFVAYVALPANNLFTMLSTAGQLDFISSKLIDSVLSTMYGFAVA